MAHGTHFVATEARAGGNCHHLKSRISTTSLVVVARVKASCLPSRDQACCDTPFSLKSVNFFGEPPSSDWLQRFGVPPMESMYATPRPSGVQVMAASSVRRSTGDGVSNVFNGGPPSNGKIIIRHEALACSFLYKQAVNFPSGEMPLLGVIL